MNILKVNGIDLAYESYGNKTDETILLIAGLGTQMIRWTVPFCEMLVARGFRVIRFDNRDTGLSTHFSHYPTLNFEALANTLMSGQRPDIPYTLNDMSDDAIGLLEALGIRKAHFVGRSMGGMIAQLAASRYPERVLSLTSIMSTTGNPDLPPTSPEIMALMTRPAPNPMEDEEGYWLIVWLLPNALAAPAIRSKWTSIVRSFERKCSEPMTREVLGDKSQQLPFRATDVRIWQK